MFFTTLILTKLAILAKIKLLFTFSVSLLLSVFCPILVKKKIVAKNMKKVDLVMYLESIGVKVTTVMKAKKDNLVQEVYDYFAAAKKT